MNEKQLPPGKLSEGHDRTVKGNLSPPSVLGNEEASSSAKPDELTIDQEARIPARGLVLAVAAGSLFWGAIIYLCAHLL